MARPLRIEFDRVFYHVTSRGNAREPIFITDTNRVLFLDKKESASIARIKEKMGNGEFWEKQAKHKVFISYFSFLPFSLNYF